MTSIYIYIYKVYEYLFDKHLPLINIMGRMIVVGRRYLDVHVPLLKHGITRKLALFCMFFKRHAIRMEFSDVLELP